MKQNLILPALALCFSTIFLFAFHTPPQIKHYGETPGRIEFIGDAGSPNLMYFETWAFTAFEMPDGAVENIQLEAEIDIKSIQGDWKDLVKSIKKKKDYFHASKFPTATVKIDGAVANEDGTYTTEAELTLKGNTKVVPLTFTISEEAPYHVVGDGLIKRKKFGFSGGGPKWEVPVHFDAVLPVE